MLFGHKLFDFACKKVNKIQQKQRKKDLSRIRKKSNLKTENGDIIMNINKEISSGYKKLGDNELNMRI